MDTISQYNTIFNVFLEFKSDRISVFKITSDIGINDEIIFDEVLDTFISVTTGKIAKLPKEIEETLLNLIEWKMKKMKGGDKMQIYVDDTENGVVIYILDDDWNVIDEIPIE